MYIYAYICNHENNVSSRLLPQRISGNSCTWAHDAHLASVKLCRGWFIYIYIYIYYTYIRIYNIYHTYI